MIFFTHIPKTAGTTLKMILRNNFGTGHIDSAKVKRPVYTASDLRLARTIFRRPEAISGHNLVNPLANIGEPGMQLITFLRDPVMRCASHFQDDVLRGGFNGTIREWISEAGHQNLTTRIIAGSDDLGLAKKLLKEDYLFVGITEHFSDSMKLLQVKLRRSLNMNYRRMITAKSNTVKDQLLADPAGMELISAHNAMDIELYEFAMKEIFLPEIKKHSAEMEQVNEPIEKKDRSGERKFWWSVKFNKWVYRPIVKLAGRS
jgi:hypothetical protein